MEEMDPEACLKTMKSKGIRTELAAVLCADQFLRELERGLSEKAA
mgnify:CR=1 FL=1